MTHGAKGAKGAKRDIAIAKAQSVSKPPLIEGQTVRIRHEGESKVHHVPVVRI